MKIELHPIGLVHSSRKEIEDDFWDKETAHIALNDDYPNDIIEGLEKFSHVMILFYMDRVNPEKISKEKRHPRHNKEAPLVGLYAQRGKNRPNQIGVTVCKIKKIDGRMLHVEGLDAIDKTPILDIKPWTKEFGPRGATFQPEWITILLKDYWK